MKKNLTCIQCPLGCQIEITLDETLAVSGNTCPRGAVYARKEITAPTRIVTSTVPVVGGEFRRVSVKTAEGIPKSKIFECMEALKTIRVPSPVHINDVILENCVGTNISVVATREVKEV